MASCKFEGGKYHGGTEAKAHMRHDDITPESRAIAAKENKHIDMTKSHLNRSLFGLTYGQMCKKYDKRIALLDSTTNTNKRKDRVTLQNIEIPVPKNLQRKNYNKWFIRITEILINEYGRDNFIDGQIHWDEEHEYIDAETKERRMSRVHCHYSIVPEVNGVLNCKKMSGRANMKKLNKAVEVMTQAEFGCSFMTGQKKKSRQTIDELKNTSSFLEAQERRKQLQAEEITLETEKANFAAYRASQIQTLQDRDANLDKKQAQLDSFADSASKMFCDAKDCYDKSKKLYDTLDVETKARYYKPLIKLNESLLPSPQNNKQKEMSL